MIWQTLKAYWKRITAIAVSVGAVLGMLWTGSGYVIQADDWVDEAEVSHQVAQVAKDQSDQALEYQKLQVEREKAAAAQEREKWRKVLELCLSGIIQDKPTCAEAQAALK